MIKNRPHCAFDVAGQKSKFGCPDLTVVRPVDAKVGQSLYDAVVPEPFVNSLANIGEPSAPGSPTKSNLG
jgi:hypothetical protein